MTAGDPPPGLVILIPVFNDWSSLVTLLVALDRVLGECGTEARLLVVDDGSTEPIPSALLDFRPSAIGRVELLSLRRNLGHQRAIAIGLAHLDAEAPIDGPDRFTAVLIMDGDGEDAPADVPRLLAALGQGGGQALVFAERTWRSERLAFRVSYRIYKLVHFLLTGMTLRVGNFSVIPRALVSRLVVVSDLWNHFPAAAHKARLPIQLVPTRRASRIAGQSKMNFTALVIHGLSAVSAFGDRVGVRLLGAILGFGGLALFGLAAMLVLRATRPATPIPTWALLGGGLAVLTSVQLLVVALAFVFTLLSGREGSSFLPVRDFHYFVGSVTTLHPGRA